MNGHIYVMGGFDHKDDEMNSPNTLSSCEFIKYEDKQVWKQTSSMNKERAYFSVSSFQNKYIYAFGGLQNYETIDSIERYSDGSWFLIQVKMPLKIAKFGLCKLDDDNILIAGGLLIQTAE